MRHTFAPRGESARKSQPLKPSTYSSGSASRFPGSVNDGHITSGKPVSINSPGDVQEREADRIADRALDTLQAGASKPCPCGGYCPSCSATDSASSRQRLAPVPSAPVSSISASAGQAIQTSVRDEMESGFGYDFSDVYIHNYPLAAIAAGAIRSRAFTYGNHIVFGEGQYAPQSTQGRRLLAHELAHVIQQTRGEYSTGVGIARQDDTRDPSLLTDDQLQTEYQSLREFLIEADPNSPGYAELASQASRLEAEIQRRYSHSSRTERSSSTAPTPASSSSSSRSSRARLTESSVASPFTEQQALFVEQFGVNPEELPPEMAAEIADGFDRITRAMAAGESTSQGEGDIIITATSSPGGIQEQEAYVDVEGGRLRVYQRFNPDNGELSTEFRYVSANGDTLVASRNETRPPIAALGESPVSQYETEPLVVPPPVAETETASPSPTPSSVPRVGEGDGLTELLVGESAADFFVDALIGEFSRDPSLGSIAVDTGVTLIPVVDQVGDARDISAHLYYLIVEGEYDEAMRWVGLVLTAIGVIPEVGTAIKGILRALLRAAQGVAENTADIVRLLRRLLPEVGDDLPALKRWIRTNWPIWRAAARDFALRSIQNATEVTRRFSDQAAAVREMAGRKIDEALDFIMREIEVAFERLAREMGIDITGRPLATVGGVPMSPGRVPDAPHRAEPMQMSGADPDELLSGPSSWDEVMDDLDRTANPRGRGEIGSSRVEPYERWIEDPAETALRRSHAQEAFQHFIDEGMMPPGTQVRSVRVQRTTAGRAQQAATTPSGISQVQEFEPHFTLPSGREFQPDSIVPRGDSGYRFVDHKTLLDRERSFYLTEEGAQALRDRMLRDVEVFDETREFGCRGWDYTTDDPVLLEVLERVVSEVDQGRGILSAIGP